MDWRDRLPEGMGPVEHEGDDITGTVSLPVDPDGYFGRQCPECERPFKLVAAEYKALPDDLILTCAYCGHEAGHGDYMTPQQRERAVAGMHALAEQFLHQQVSDMLGSVFGNSPRVRPGESGVEMTYTPGSPPPVAALPSYVEERTVRSLQCAGCGNHYAVYGAAAFCPICGPRPSIDTVRESLAAARQTLQLEDALPTTMRQAMRAEGVFDQLAAHAVKSTVTLFEVYANDQFGRRVPTAAAVLRGRGNVFQRLDDADTVYRDQAGFAMSSLVSSDVWDRLRTLFAQRHVLVHRNGTIDQRYLDQVPSSRQRVGQQLVVSRLEAQRALDDLEALVVAMDGQP